ncbi:hypothetical protein A5633_07960 [Mycolicibacterium elephantis]|uniref:SIR2 family protein n=1 Tax=Mycolicibacterium elephantis TaxID=81858 RepID=UPI0007EA55C9|nr:SIR2 family protein [Mycolicibacterium elephantis]OBA89089.1 hypothetical protein A5633_07960 [Mycolicibacterium elephantis]
MAGHLFIVHGDLTAIACDAILIPTDAVFDITEAWQSLDLKPTTGGWAGDTVVKVRANSREPRIWLGNIGKASDATEFKEFVPVLQRFVERAVEDLESTERADWIYPWPKWRLAVNVVGSGYGGARLRKGDLARGLVRALQELADEHDIDIILVTFRDKQYAAAQRARRQVVDPNALDRTWQFATRGLAAKARHLADLAIDNRLVLFIGAGVSAGAGLPTWKDLLTNVAADAKVNPQYLKLLDKHDLRDWATLIDRKMGPDKDIREAVARVLCGSERYSLQHALLASLPSTEAVTTNFDQLFERASRVADRDLAVLPTHPRTSSTSWLLKLHGSVDNPPGMVLTRSDYLDMPRYHGALMGLVQGLLLTRHMLYVGYSLSDEDFHDLVHEVRAARGSSEPGQATMLTLFDDPIQRELWQDDLNVITMSPERTPVPEAARELELFLDLIGFLSTTSASFFLDPTYDSLSEDEPSELRESLKKIMEITKGAKHDSVAHQVRKFLNGLGAE